MYVDQVGGNFQFDEARWVSLLVGGVHYQPDPPSPCGGHGMHAVGPGFSGDDSQAVAGPEGQAMILRTVHGVGSRWVSLLQVGGNFQFDEAWIGYSTGPYLWLAKTGHTKMGVRVAKGQNGWYPRVPRDRGRS